MPTPVTTARQCLTAEASKGLDEAVIVAKRRGHAQTTSLHVISSFLILPSSSILRDACLRTRNSSYSSNVKFKALELCFNVALDRLPSSQHNGSSNVNEPPVSNSLMAAIKRSQANQRRNPESYHLYHLQQNQQQSSVSCVKVEIRQLVLSILDDPVVSRVFADAGFRSTDIKFSILRPLRYNSSYPPLFLCNLAGAAGVGQGGGSVSDYESSRKSFSFPFSGFSEVSDGDENCKRIGEILVRKKGRNPLLVGVHAKDAITSFKENVESLKNGVLPVELSRLDFISIETEVMEFVTKNGSERLMGLKFDELSKLAKNSSGTSGVVVCFGDLKGFSGDGSSSGDASTYLISKLTNLVETCSGRLWIMGSTSSYETYLRFITQFPTVEKDWDLQILPTASFRSSIGGYFSRPHSLMESFIPLGGFFSTSANLTAPLGSTYQPFSHCKLCGNKCEQEVSAVLAEEHTISLSDQHQASLPAWLQSTEIDTNIGLDSSKAKYDKTELHTKVAELQKKWNDICQCLHYNSTPLERDVNRVGSQAFPCIMGFPVTPERKERADNHVNIMIDASPIGSVCDSALTKLPQTSEQGVTLSPVDSKDKSESSPHKLHLRPSKGEENPTCSLSVVLDGHESPCSAASVTTDLGLGTLYSSVQDPNHPNSRANEEHLRDSLGYFPIEVDVVKEKPLKPQLQSSSCTGPNKSGKIDSTDFKLLWKSLKEKVGRQDEAIYAVSRTVALCRSGKERRRGARLKGDIWFSFLGSDMVAKKKLAIALAEMLFGSRESVICVDLACPDGICPPNSIFHSKKMNGFDTSFRGSFIVDYIYSEIRKNPLSVVFLENVDRADIGVHNCLVHAIQTGKFIDSRGREISINNSVFAVTSSDIKSYETFSFRKETSKFSEEKILVAQGWQMQILIRNDPECITALCNKLNVFVSSRNPSSVPAFLNKRKLIETLETAKRIQKTSNKYLDLNLPVEDLEATSEDFALASLDNLTSLVDECVLFEPFDFDYLAGEVHKKMDESYKNIIGNVGFLEVDSQAMEQILAAAWFCDNRKSLDNWVEHVLGSTFAEARERYSVRAGTVLKLVSCEGLPMQDQALEVCLPARIILE
ncbi:hypothetical protein MKX01_016453 [Papaver californicum]|nr:hypothetical protein MKX01_016453 [Papaver californicum]